jgi:ethanolamine-phosphate cytidylyltransferase
MGKYRSIPRTEGVSTTDIVGRMLLCTKEHHAAGTSPDCEASSSFYTTSSLMQAFSADAAPRAPDARVVYIDGTWDMFHAGHIKVLEKAKRLGDYLIVGVHSDEDVNARRGKNYPIMNIHERVLSVLGCKHVDDVLIDAPWRIESAMLQSLGVDLVVAGRLRDKVGKHWTGRGADGDEDPYEVPRSMGIFREIVSTSELTVGEIVRRIHLNRKRYEARFARKKKKEDAYYAERYGEGQGKGAAGSPSSKRAGRSTSPPARGGKKARGAKRATTKRRAATTKRRAATTKRRAATTKRRASNGRKRTRTQSPAAR